MANLLNDYYIQLGSYWQQLGQDIDGEAVFDQSGYSVSLSADGTIVAIGARYNNGNSGHVRVYQFQNGSWTQIGSDIDGEYGGDQSGFSVSLNSDGTIVAIGARYNSPSGHVRVYQLQNGSWTQMGSDIDGESANDESGYSVSLNASGTIVAIGAPNNNPGSPGQGHVRVYQFQNGSWTQMGTDINGASGYDKSGISVSLSADGQTIAIGSPFNDQNGTDSGHIRIYTWINNSWTQKGSNIIGETARDESGTSVSLNADGTIVAIGAIRNDGTTGSIGDNRGHVRIYKFVNNSWNLMGLDIDGEVSGDQTGYSVSLSANGLTVAIGAINNDTNGSNSGNVRIYTFINNSWIKVGENINGETSNDQSGFSVSLSDDGQTIAIGAPSNDGINSDNIGHVRVYKLVPPPYSNICFPSGTPVQLDQGIVPIDKINPAIHTIRGNKIETVTRTITRDKYLICIETDALAKNIPSQKTLISKNHKLFYNGKMVPANDLLLLNSNNDKIYKVKYSGEVLYNILLDNEKHDKMIVNNLICETLDPKNGIATMYYDMKNVNYSVLEKVNFIKEYNEYVIKNNTFRK